MAPPPPAPRRAVRPSLLASALVALSLAVVPVAGPPSSPAAATAAGSLRWAQVSGGYDHTCAVAEDASLWCWGANGEGQLGLGSSVDQDTPQLVTAPAGVTWASVSSGWQTTCALSTDGDAYCWGNTASSTSLGTGTFDPDTPELVLPPDGLDPGEIDHLRISNGARHQCSSTTTGDVYCWGLGNTGRLGTGSNALEVTPAAVAGPTDPVYDTIAAGGRHTCATTPDGRGYCWGNTTEGATGTPALGGGEVRIPTLVETPPGHDWASMETGADHSCGLTTSERLYCWGLMGHGRLGTIEDTGLYYGQTVPQRVLAPWFSTGHPAWRAVTLGEYFTCGLTASGHLHCWGSDDEGQLANGDLVSGDQARPHPTVPPPGGTWASVDAGRTHACAITATDARLFCWGRNDTGQLGDGTTTERQEPVEVAVDGPDQAQTITFGALAPRSFGGGPVPLLATASSGLPVTFEATGACTRSGTTLTLTDVGTCTVRADQAGDETWLPAPQVVRSFSVLPAKAEISVSEWSQTYDGSPRAVTVTTDPPGLAVLVRYDGSAAAPTGAGTYDVLVQLDDRRHVATDVSGRLRVAQASQAVALEPIASVDVAVGSVTASAAASSGLPVTFEAVGPCQAAGPAIQLTGTGDCTVTATQVGTANIRPAAASQTFAVTGTTGALAVTGWDHVYDGTPKGVDVVTDPAGSTVTVTYDGSPTEPTSAGTYAVLVVLDGDPSVTASGTLTIVPQGQAITFDPLPDVPEDAAPFLLVATASSGLEVTFFAAGACSVAGSSLTVAGVGPCTVTASQAGDGDREAAGDVSHTFEVVPGALLDAIVNVVDLEQVYDGTPRPVGVLTDPPGLRVDLTYDGSPTAPTAAGTYAVLATLDSETHRSDAVVATLVVAAAPQVVTFEPLGTAEVGGASVPVVASASSGLPVALAVDGACSLTGLQITLTGPEGCAVEATQPGDANWQAALPVSRSLTPPPVELRPAAVEVTDLSQTYDGSPRAVGVTTDPPGLSVEVTYDGSTTPPVDAGTYEVRAVVDDPAHDAATERATLVVARAGQTITVEAPDQVGRLDRSVELVATASSGLPVALAAAGTCSLDERTIVPEGLGACTVTASQGGSGNWEPASEVTATVTIVSTATVQGLPQEVRSGDVVEVQLAGFDPGERVDVTFRSDPLDLGSATIDATGAATFRFTVPGVEPGAHRLVATGASSGLTAAAATTVLAPDGPTPGPVGPSTGGAATGSGSGLDGVLPRTGADLLLAVLVGMALVVVGGAARRLAR